MTTKNPSGASNLQILVDCFDDIPSIMSKMNVSLNDSPTRFKATGPNTSYAVDGVLRASQRVDISRRENAHRVERMATQAMRVLDQLSKIPGAPKRVHRDPAETAAIARSKLEKLEKTGVDLRKYYALYDVNRSGKISYKDFGDTLLAVSAGLSREEAYQLASQLDSNRVGSVDYTNLLGSLGHINETQRQQKEATGFSSAVANSAAQTSPREAATAESTSSKVAPRTSFSYVGASSNGNSNGNTADAASAQESAGAQGHAAESAAPAMRPLSDRHSTTYSPPRRELDARSVIARRFFYNPTVNTPVYGDSAQLQPYQFDRSSREGTPQALTKSRRRASSAPGRARNSSLLDSGCNLAPTPRPAWGDEFGGVFRRSPTSTTEVSVDDAALVAKLEGNPFYRADERVARLQETIRTQETRTLENAVVNQIGGGVARLRHMLRKHDASQSGMLNTEEFKFALKKAGVHLSGEQYEKLYTMSARDVAETSIHGYNRGKAVDIDAFTARLQETVASADSASAPSSVGSSTSAPSASSSVSEFSAKYGGKAVFGDAAKHLDKVRVMKKVLQSAAKLSNPHAIYNHIEPAHNGFLSEHQMQDALVYMGANLSQAEFGVLMKSVPKDPEGKVEIARFEKALRGEVSEYDKSTAQQAEAQHRTFRHYSGSFRTSDDFALSHQSTEYDPLCHRRGQAEETETSRRWGQLQDIFQRNPEVVRAAFSEPRPASPERISLRDSHAERPIEIPREETKTVSVSGLKEKLAKSGLPLSADDILRVERTLARKGASSEVSLGQFCEAVGLEVKVKDRDRLELQNTHERVEDGGVFRPSLKTQHVNPSVSTSFYEGSTASTDKVPCTGDRRKRAPSSNQGHTSDPSRFWEIVDAVRSDQGLSPLFPSPMPTFRSSNILDTAHAGVAIDPTAAVRGIVRLDPSAAQAQRQQPQQESARGRRHNNADGTEAAPARRAASAPPRTLLSRSAMFNNASHNVASLLQHQGAADSTDQSAVSRATKSSTATSVDSSSGNALQTAAKIARWAPGTLSSYYETRERLNIAGTATEGSGSPGRRMKSSLRKQYTAPASSATSSRAGASGAAASGSSAASVSSNAPFATGSTFA